MGERSPDELLPFKLQVEAAAAQAERFLRVSG
jgi:hypothetical protein